LHVSHRDNKDALVGLQREIGAGAARIGAEALDQRIEGRTRDELEMLADQFNSLAVQPKESYASRSTKWRHGRVS
jgi:nitrate/nitrite-specific signal transduction histidine kinase